VRILALSGSLRAASFNTALLRAAEELAFHAGTFELYDGLDRLPHYNEDRDTDTPPTEVARLRTTIRRADAVLIATPEFNGTMPGHLKQAIDWASRPHGRGSALWGKPVMVVGASVTDYGAIWAQDHVRKALGLAGARVVDGELALARAPEHFDADGKLTDEDAAARLVELVESLVAVAAASSAPAATVSMAPGSLAHAA
jgi:chromate reductase